MGNCIYCGLKAGIFSNYHKECKFLNTSGKERISEVLKNAIINSFDLNEINIEIESIINDNFIKKDEVRPILVRAYEKAVGELLENGEISIVAEAELSKYQKYYNLKQIELNVNGAMEKIAKAAIVRDILLGRVEKIEIGYEGNLPFIFQKSEKLIWVFNNAEYLEKQNKIQYQGKTSGISIKIAKGLHYRTGSFKGNPIATQELKFIDTGIVALTDLSIYFASNSKKFKVPYNKLIAIEPFFDAIEFQKDGTSSKPQIIRGIDGSFCYNIISNLI
jgi:ribosomal protein L30E